MREELKEKFVLLSQVAKEKKYAQEYLGLLARRGDIGSLRIGKRWYTTWEWVEEFLENSQKKKAEIVLETAGVKKSKVEVEQYVPKISKADEGCAVKIDFPIVPPAREKVYAFQPAAARPMEEAFSIPVKIPVAAKKIERETRIFGDIQRTVQVRQNVSLKKELLPRKVSVEERNRHAVPYREVKMKKSDGVFSPDFSKAGSLEAAIFPRFAFAASFAIIICLVALSGYFAYTAGLFEKGQVAGASSASAEGFSSIQSEGEKLLSGAGGKIKESLSVSRVVMEVAREKFGKEDLGN
jgi:hypothetical protein